MVSNTKKEIQENYGFFFPPYVQHIIKNKDKLNELYNKALQKIKTKGIPKESQDIAERSKNIYAGIMVAGYLCEEIFKEIGLPCREKVEVERMVNKYFSMCVINDPVEPDYIKALRIIYDWSITESRKFIVEYSLDKEPKFEICGKISNEYIDIIGTEFTKKMKESGFSPTAIKKALFENGISVCTDKRQNGDYSIKIEDKKSSGIRIIRSVMEDKVGLLIIEETEDPKYMIKKVLETVKFLVRMGGVAEQDQIARIVRCDVEDYLSQLEDKMKIIKISDGKYC